MKKRAAIVMGTPRKKPRRARKPKGNVIRLVADNTKPALVTPSGAPAKPRISIEAIAASSHGMGRRKQQNRGAPTTGNGNINPWTIPKPPPGVVPSDATTMAMDNALVANIDYAVQAYSNYNQGMFNEGLFFLGYPYLAELAQRSEYRRISETIATEMTRKWIKFSATGDDDKTDRIKELEAAVEDFKVQDRFRDSAEKDGYFGRAHLYLDIKNAWKDKPELGTPIGEGNDDASKAKLSQGCLTGIKTVEAMWTYPNDFDSVDPLNPTFYNPQTWYINSTKVHSSRLLLFVGREVPDLLKPAYVFGGVSMSQIAKPYIDIWLRNRSSVADLIHSFSVSGIETDLSTLLAGDGSQLTARATVFNNMRDNSGLMLIQKDAEKFFNVSTPLSTLDALLSQSQEHMCSVSGIPAVKLLGIQPAGFNASSEGELVTFGDYIRAYQKKFFSKNLRKVIDIIMIHLWGQIDKNIVFDYVPLEEMSEKEIAEIGKMKAETDDLHINAGTVSPLEARRAIAADASSPYSIDNPEDLPEPPVDETGLDDPDADVDVDGGPADGEEAVDGLPFARDDWNETDHPRGQPGNAGQFGSGGGSSGGGKAVKGGSGGQSNASAKTDGFTAPAPTPEQRRKDIKSVLKGEAKLSYAYRTKVSQAIEQARADQVDNKTLAQLLGKMFQYYYLRKADFIAKGEHSKAAGIDKLMNKTALEMGRLVDADKPPGEKRPEPPKPEPPKDKPLSEKEQKILSISHDVAKEMGFPPERITVTNEEYHFTLNGKACKAAGTAQLGSKTIKMYSNNLPNVAGSFSGAIVKMVTAHEVMHCKFQTVMENARYGGELGKAFNELYADGKDSMFELEISDGVTDYSTEYWKGFGKGNITKDSAVHETLAEIAGKKINKSEHFHKMLQRVDAEASKGNLTPKAKERWQSMSKEEKGATIMKGRERWQKLYDLVESEYPKLKAHK